MYCIVTYIHVLYCNIYTLQYVKKKKTHARTHAREREKTECRSERRSRCQSEFRCRSQSLFQITNLGAARSSYSYYKNPISALYNLL